MEQHKNNGPPPPKKKLKQTSTAAAAAAHRVVVVGAGFGGLAVVEGLLYNHKHNVRVTLLDRKDYFSIGGTWQFVWSNRLKEHQTRWPLAAVKFHAHERVDTRFGSAAGTVTHIDTDQQRVTLQDGTLLQYDTLVMSAGVVSDAGQVPGLAESGALNVCDITHVGKMRETLDTIATKAKRDPSLTQTVVMCVTRMPYKCPPVPFEVVSVIHNVLCQAGVRDSVRIILTVPVDFPFAGPAAKELFEDLMKQLQVDFWTNHKVESVDRDGTVHLELPDGSTKTLETDALFCTFPQRAPDVIQETGLCNDSGFVPVELQTNLIPSIPNVFVVGDACHVVFPKTQQLHPKSGEFAYFMGRDVAKRILANVGSKTTDDDDDSPPRVRKAACVAEVGVGDKGVNVQPNLSPVLQDPQQGEPTFQMDIVKGAATRKAVWVNKYLERFYGPGNYAPFPEDA